MVPLPAKRNNPTQASNSAKKRKNDGTEPEVKGEFETKLANLDPSSQASTSLAPTQYKDFKNSRQVGAEKTWPRPPVDHKLQIGSSQSIPFQLVDLDYIMDRADVVVRLFGVTKAGNSICASVQGYRPYFYASAPAGFGEEHIANAIKMLNDQMKTGGQSSYFGVPADITSLVTDIELVQGTSLYNYSNTGPSLFLKIYVVSPRLITSCKNSLFVLNKITGGEDDVVKAFEANLDFEVRFMADLDIVGCGWVELLANKYYHVPNNKRQTFCQLEVLLNLENLIVHSPSSPEWSGIAPLRTLSFDIECLGRKGIFPEATHDPIIQIASMVKIEGESEPFIRNCFVTGSCTAVMGSDIIECESETELLEKWAAFIRAVDPDIITGYNIQNFDLPYIIDRAKHLKIDSKISYLSRVKSNMCRIRDASLQSKQMGNRVNKLISMEGRIVFDVLQLITRDYKLRSYTLNNVSYHFLGEQKEDVDYNYIPYLQNGTAGERRRLAVYCMKDAYLPLRLLDKLMLVINYIEMARVTGVPVSFLVFRGQQVKILSQLVRKTRQRNIFLPVIESAGADNETYEGATVIEPLKGYYQQPIATLDFASLYPSIMIAHNLCYTTLLSKPMARELVENEDYVKTPSGDMFVKNHLRRGILPEILEDLLSARKKAKTDLKSEKDPFRQMVLNGRQLALKISANSVYGFTGATVGKLPCLSISQSVTSFGREMIDQTKTAVESYYKKGAVDGKCPIDAQVIYGDTDSVMVKFGVDTVAEAMELGQHAATNVSQQFIKPIKLEFEKVYYPYLLINKKRYAGLYYTRPDKYDKMDCKGLETVRRDNCPLVVNVLNVCLEKLMIDKDKDGAVAYAKRVISDLLANRIDISMLIISKELTKKGEKYAAKQAHVELAERMRKRDPGSAPRLGDRVPYVIVAMTGKVSAYEKAEDPIYVLKNEIPIDTKYYLEHQLKNPLERLFDPIFMDKSVNVLFTGDHTKKKTTTKSPSHCLGCKGILSVKEEESPPPTCEHCLPNIGRIYTDFIMQLKDAERRFARLWAECQNCAGNLQEEVSCFARDCPIFYMREKARSDVYKHTQTMKRFRCNKEER
ncbi:DNA polymerase family B domain-containing protein [Ditylenchus destructor]|uniref:DNA polymerase n=1 Tax=Ditylenchus destructor TaxID=166010 RepID=A0AAD4NAU4_9BILA|nr:DNA polymerase family B domain-containing protein [Ditylenchus destructor]